jgi:hypothetical protein
MGGLRAPLQLTASSVKARFNTDCQKKAAFSARKPTHNTPCSARFGIEVMIPRDAIGRMGTKLFKRAKFSVEQGRPKFDFTLLANSA